MKKDFLKNVLFLLLSFVLVFIDQVTKKEAFLKLYGKEPFVVIKNIIEFVYTENRGAAFGILQDKRWLFIPITIIVLILILYFIYKTKYDKHYLLYYLNFCLIFSGAIGNMIDRIINTYVIDFIYFKPIDFPVFNIADSYITVGCVLMVISILTIYKNDNLF